MSWWNAKYTNNDGEYEITFASKDYEKAKAVEKVCCAVMDRAVKSPMDVEVVVRCRECKHHYWEQEPCHGKIVHYCELPHMRGVEVFKEFFCYYGERKEGADNG